MEWATDSLIKERREGHHGTHLMTIVIVITHLSNRSAYVTDVFPQMKMHVNNGVLITFGVVGGK